MKKCSVCFFNEKGNIKVTRDICSRNRPYRYLIAHKISEKNLHIKVEDGPIAVIFIAGFFAGIIGAARWRN